LQSIYLYNRGQKCSLFFLPYYIWLGDDTGMIYKNEYVKPLGAWESFYSEFIDRAESCYLRWINCDEELTEAEEKLAVKYQEMIEAEESDGDFIEIEMPPEFDVTPEEFEAFCRVIQKLQKAGLSSLFSAMLGQPVSSLTNDTTHKAESSSKCSNIKALQSQYFTNDTRVF
jgi:hypothetical protein